MTGSVGAVCHPVMKSSALNHVPVKGQVVRASRELAVATSTHPSTGWTEVSRGSGSKIESVTSQAAFPTPKSAETMVVTVKGGSGCGGGCGGGGGGDQPVQVLSAWVLSPGGQTQVGKPQNGSGTRSAGQEPDEVSMMQKPGIER